MKVKLNCVFGDKTPGTVVDLKKDVAEKLIANGNATDAKDAEVAKDSKEVTSLKARVVALEEEVKTISDAKIALEEEVKTISDAKIALEEEVKTISKK